MVINPKGCTHRLDTGYPLRVNDHTPKKPCFDRSAYGDVSIPMAPFSGELDGASTNSTHFDVTGFDPSPLYHLFNHLLKQVDRGVSVFLAKRLDH